nr:hypothetical transcript [Hymenolepis microstoma]
MRKIDFKERAIRITTIITHIQFELVYVEKLDFNHAANPTSPLPLPLPLLLPLPHATISCIKSRPKGHQRVTDAFNDTTNLSFQFTTLYKSQPRILTQNLQAPTLESNTLTKKNVEAIEILWSRCPSVAGIELRPIGTTMIAMASVKLHSLTLQSKILYNTTQHHQEFDDV